MSGFQNENEKREIKGKEIVPFESAQEAWFWFVQSEKARHEGARFNAGMSLYPRPCEPADIVRVIDRLYRNRRLLVDHLKILRHYGIRMLAPDPYRIKEARAHTLWCEAMERIEEILVRKGVVRERCPIKDNWARETLAYEQMMAAE